MGISKLNKGGSVDWGIETKEFPFKKCSEMELEKEFPLKGCFITPDKGFGQGAVLISDGFLLNAPASALDDVKTILSDDEIVESIKAGKCAFKVRSFVSKTYKRTGYAIDYIDKE